MILRHVPLEVTVCRDLQLQFNALLIRLGSLLTENTKELERGARKDPSEILSDLEL